ncbi:Spectrin beta chain, non-erythrocytic 5 [Branchiostoma belcheri]|nr:Spectrin beta chain, non-erythrocytic 5 [Branchiostoma belcheri]
MSVGAYTLVFMESSLHESQQAGVDIKRVGRAGNLADWGLSAPTWPQSPICAQNLLIARVERMDGVSQFEKGRIQALQQERIHIQQKTFTKWMNSFLEKAVSGIYAEETLKLTRMTEALGPTTQLDTNV